MTLFDATNDTPLLAFDVTTTLADHLAFSRFVRSRPAWRQKLIRNAIGMLLAAPLLALALSAAMLWTLSGTSCDLDAIGVSRGAFFGSALGGVLGAGLAGAGVVYLFRWRNIEASVRQQLLRRPHIDPNDPELHEQTSLSMHALGFRSANASAGYAYSWAVTEGFDETADHIFVMVETAFGFILPKRDLPADTVLSLREIAKQVGKPSPVPETSVP